MTLEITIISAIDTKNQTNIVLIVEFQMKQQSKCWNQFSLPENKPAILQMMKLFIDSWILIRTTPNEASISFQLLQPIYMFCDAKIIRSACKLKSNLGQAIFILYGEFDMNKWKFLQK